MILKIKSTFFRGFVGLLFLAFIGFTALLIVFYYHITTSIDTYIAPAQQKVLLHTIGSSKELPKNVSMVLDKYYVKELNNTYLKSIRTGILQRKYIDCYSSQIAHQVYYLHNRNAGILAAPTTALWLENYFTPKQCFQYLFNVFNMNYRSIEDNSQHIFNQPLSSLDEEQVLKLIIMMDVPTFYHPIKHPENSDRRVKEIMNRANP